MTQSKIQLTSPFSSIVTNRGSAKMKRFLLSATACFAVTAATITAGIMPSSYAAVKAATSVSSSETMQEAFDKLIADSKSQMMRNPAMALDLAKNAEALVSNATSFNDRETSTATALWLQGEAFVRTAQPEKGAALIDRALTLIGDEASGTKLSGDLLLARGRVAGRLSDVQMAVKSYYRAHDTFVALNENRSEAMTLQAIGSIYRDAQSYPRALEYYQRAADVYGGDNILALTSYNNQANTLRDMERYSEARDYFQKAHDLAVTLKSDVLQGRILTNLAELEVLSGNLSAAKKHVAKAYDKLSPESSSEWRRFVLAVESQIALAENNVELAQGKIDQAFDGLDLNETNMSFEEMHSLGYDIYQAQDNAQMALAHHKNFKRLSDEAKKVAASANLALLGVQFNVAQQDLKIERLKSEQLNSDILLEKAKKRDAVQVAVMTVSGLVILFFFTVATGLRNHRNRMAKANNELQDTVDLLNGEIERRQIVERDLVIAKDDAEQANRLKSTFLATMSHELRTPMNGILGFSKILQAGELQPEQREQVDIIHQSGESLLCLINDILDISQIEAGKMNLNLVPFNLRASIESATKLLQSKAQEKSLNIAVHIDPELPTMVKGDGDRIRQIVMNLLGNAIKFTETGSVAVFVGNDSEADKFKISVVDTGVGIPDDKVDILFDRFSQVDNSSTRQHDGSGLGLAICKELTDAMGGDIGVRTQIGEGSEFWVSIPLVNAEDVDVLRRETPVSANDKRVLVVDDLAINQRVYSLILSGMNADHVEVSCAEDTIRLLMDSRNSGEPFDAIIISDTLSTIRSFELLEKLQRNNLVGTARMILSAPGRVESSALTAMGFDTQIEQPITDETVFSELRALILDDREPIKESTPVSSEIISLAEKASALRPATRRVLVAEDNLANKQFVSAVLSSFDVETDIVANGADAVEAAKTNGYDMILMDIHMPIMNGVEATKRIRSPGQLNSDTPIVALTAVAMNGDRDRFIEAGMDDVLPKPLELASLRSKIAATLDRAGAAKSEQPVDNNVVSLARIADDVS